VRPCLPITLPISWDANPQDCGLAIFNHFDGDGIGNVNQRLNDLEDELFHRLSRLAVCSGSSFVHHRHLLGDMLRRSDSTNRLNLGEVFRGGTTATGTDRVAFWGDRKLDTKTTLS
jgi:hypothetical protein